MGCQSRRGGGGGGGQGAVALPHPNRFCRYDNPIQIGVLADYAQPDFQAFLYIPDMHGLGMYYVTREFIEKNCQSHLVKHFSSMHI